MSLMNVWSVWPAIWTNNEYQVKNKINYENLSHEYYN